MTKKKKLTLRSGTKTKRRKGAGKGQGFERYSCKALSKWLSRGMRDDIFWRSAMSGGRATLRSRKRTLDSGKRTHAQAGDICAVHSQGERLLRHFFVDCKFYKDLNIQSLLTQNISDLSGMWMVATAQAVDHGRHPLLIVRENFLPDELVITDELGAILLGLNGRECLIFPVANAHFFWFRKTFLQHARRPE